MSQTHEKNGEEFSAQLRLGLAICCPGFSELYPLVLLEGPEMAVKDGTQRPEGEAFESH